MPYEVRQIARLVAAILLVFLLGLPALASAQSSYHVRFAKAENTIRTHEPTITWWEQQSKITLGIGLTIVAAWHCDGRAPGADAAVDEACDARGRRAGDGHDGHQHDILRR